MLWTSCGLIVDFLPYYIKTKKETKKNSLKGSLQKNVRHVLSTLGSFFQTMLETFANYAGSSRKFPA